jgi:hypothetical protein
MAYVRQYKGRWRAEIDRLGVRKSKTFDQEADARAWVAAAEPAVVARQQRGMALSEAKFMDLVPRRVLDAMRSTEFSKDEVIKAGIPCVGHCGIYFLIADNDVIYVGQSIDVFGRISRHRRDGREFDAYAYLPCDKARLDATEAAYIMAFMPWLNLALGQVPTKALGKQEA